MLETTEGNTFRGGYSLRTMATESHSRCAITIFFKGVLGPLLSAHKHEIPSWILASVAKLKQTVAFSVDEQNNAHMANYR